MATSEDTPGEGASIDPKILESLGLTHEDMENFDAEAKKEEKLLKVLEDEGKDFYANPRDEERVSGGYLRLIRPSVRQQIQMPKRDEVPALKLAREYRRPSEVPRELMKEWKDKSRSQFSPYQAFLSPRVEAFIFGYGLGALDNLDAETAINAFSEINPEGVLNNPKVVDTLRTYSQQDRTIGVTIAKAIQTKIDRDARLNTPPVPSTPQPET